MNLVWIASFPTSEMGSIPTAPTIYLPDGWTLNQNTRGQKGVDSADDPVLFFFLAARVTTGRANFKVNRHFLEPRLNGAHDLQVEFKPLCVPPSSLRTRHSDGSNGGPGSRWLLERSRTFLTS